MNPENLGFYPAPWASPSEDIHPTATPEKTPEKPSRVKLTGYVAWTPKFKERDDRAYLNFTLATHDEQGETTYHRMYSTKDYARRIQGKGLKRGDLIEVTGVWQQKVIKDGKLGTVKTVPTLYCYGVRIR